MKKVFAISLIFISFFALAGRDHHNHEEPNKPTKNTPVATQSYSPNAAKMANWVPSNRAGSETIDMFGTKHSRLRQVHMGVPVIGAEIIKHTRNGKETTSGRFAVVKNINVRPSISSAAAYATVTDTYGQNPFASELAILPTAQGARLVWHFSEQSFDSRWTVSVDAHTGEVLNAFNDIHTGSGTGVLGDTKSLDTTFNGSEYEMVAADGSRDTYTAKTRTRLPGDLMTDADDVWTDGAAVDAHHYAGLVLNYYSTILNRDSWDGNGAIVRSTVHYNRNYVNAFWNGTQMVYGDGDNVNSLALSGGFDVVAHEITHAVTDATSDLIYQNESGALNEAFSDIMAAAAEYYEQPTQFDWMVGEDIWLADAALRFMDDPTRDGSSTDHYDDRYTGSSDNGGVHWNSGIANLAFVLASDGGSHPTYGGSYQGVGIETATQIFYTAFTQYLAPSSGFADARAACTQVALDNYGQATADLIDAAWAGVGAPADGGPSGPTVIPVAIGETFESSHPYGNNENITWEVTNPGASSITINFSVLDMERNYDYIYVKDGNDTVIATFTARSNNGETVTVNGDVARVNMVTDASVTKQGFVAVAN